MRPKTETSYVVTRLLADAQSHPGDIPSRWQNRGSGAAGALPLADVPCAGGGHLSRCVVGLCTPGQPPAGGNQCETVLPHGSSVGGSAGAKAFFASCAGLCAPDL